jgi:hypothetical protein
MNLLGSTGRSLSEAVENRVQPTEQAEVIDRVLMIGSSCSFANQFAVQTEFDVANLHVLVIFNDYPSETRKVGHSVIGLSQTLGGREGISAYLSQPKVSALATLRKPNRPTLYYRNGILVGHTGSKITPGDVANALEEE